MEWLCWKCLKSMALREVSSGNASGSRSGGCRLVVGGSGSGRGSDSGKLVMVMVVVVVVVVEAVVVVEW